MQQRACSATGASLLAHNTEPGRAASSAEASRPSLCCSFAGQAALLRRPVRPLWRDALQLLLEQRLLHLHAPQLVFQRRLQLAQLCLLGLRRPLSVRAPKRRRVARSAGRRRRARGAAQPRQPCTHLQQTSQHRRAWRSRPLSAGASSSCSAPDAVSSNPARCSPARVLTLSRRAHLSGVTQRKCPQQSRSDASTAHASVRRRCCALGGAPWMPSWAVRPVDNTRQYKRAG